VFDDFRVCVSAQITDGQEQIIDEGCNVKSVKDAIATLRDWADDLEKKYKGEL